MRRILKFLGWTFAVLMLLIAAVVIHANYRIGTDERLAFDEKAPGRYVTVENRRQHFVTIGDPTADATGAPILVIHGFIIAGHTSLMPWAADELGKERSLILADLMGYGYSQRDPVAGSWSSPASSVRYLVGMLDQLGVQQVDIVGSSYGGAIAARFALDYPQRVRRIVYLNPGLYLPKSKAEYIIDMPLGVGRALTWHFLGAGPLSFVGRYCRDKPDCAWAPTPRIKDTTETLRAMMRTNRETPVLEELYADIPKLRTPGLMIRGMNDIFLPAWTYERFQKDSGVRVLELPGASHLPWFDQPSEVARATLDFLTP